MTDEALPQDRDSRQDELVPDGGARRDRIRELLLAGSAAVLSVLYGLTVIRSISKPLNAGEDTRWALVWIAFVIAVTASASLRAIAAARFWATCAAVAALAMVVLSHSTGAALAAMWFLALAWTAGDTLFPTLHDDSGGADAALSKIVAGVGVLCLLAQLLAVLQLLNRAAVGIVMTALTALLVWRVRRLVAAVGSLKRSLSNLRPSSWETAITSVTLFVFLIDLAWAVVPEIQFDALNYQLAVPRLYVEHGGVVDLPYFWHSYYAHLFNMLFAVALVLSTAKLAKLLILATAIVTTLIVYRIGAKLFSPLVGLAAATLFFTTPLVCWLSTTAYVDLPVAMFVAAAMLSHVCWRDEATFPWLIASGLLVGLAVGTKVNASFVALPLVAFVVWRLKTGNPQWRIAKQLAGYLVVIAAVALPSYAIVYAFTGNPVFPLMNAVFRSPRWEPTNTAIHDELYGVGASPRALASIPVALTFDTSKFAEALPAGGVGPFLFLLPLSLVLGARGTRKWGFWYLVSIAAVFLLFWGVLLQSARHYIAILPAVILLAIHPLFTLRNGARRVAGGALFVLLVAQAALIPLLFWQIPERIPLRAALGRESASHFLLRACPAYEACEYVNRFAKPGERVLGVNMESMRFFMTPPMDAVFETRSLDWLEGTGQHPADIARGLQKAGYTFLVASAPDEEQRRNLAFLRPDFVESHTAVEFSRGSTVVYRLGAVASGPIVNLLMNPGFEAMRDGLPQGWTSYGHPKIRLGSAHSGEKAIIASGDAGFYQGVRVTGGQIYTIGHFTRADEEGQSARLQVNWVDAKGKFLHSDIKVVPVARHWQYHSRSTLAPSYAARAIVYASVHERSSVEFDDLWFAAGASAEPRGN